MVRVGGFKQDSHVQNPSNVFPVELWLRELSVLEFGRGQSAVVMTGFQQQSCIDECSGHPLEWLCSKQYSS